MNEVENGKRNISVINLEKLVIALGTNFCDFFKTDLFVDKVEKPQPIDPMPPEITFELNH